MMTNDERIERLENIVIELNNFITQKEDNRKNLKDLIDDRNAKKISETLKGKIKELTDQVIKMENERIKTDIATKLAKENKQ